MFSTPIPVDQRELFKYLPREILSKIIVDCDTLQEVKNLCEAEKIVLNTEELNLLSEKHKLPYVMKGGLEYLLRCSRFIQGDFVREFLKQDDPRVLEYYPAECVARYLFPKREMHCFTKVEQEVVYDCPTIAASLFRREEWNEIYKEGQYCSSYFHLQCIVLNYCHKTLKVLLEYTDVPVLEPILGLTIRMNDAKAFKLLISSPNISEDIDWIFLITTTVQYARHFKNLEAQRIVALLIRYLVNTNKTALITSMDLKWIKKEEIVELYDTALERGNTKFSELLMKTYNLTTI